MRENKKRTLTFNIMVFKQKTRKVESSDTEIPLDEPKGQRDVLFLEVDGLNVHRQQSERGSQEIKIGVVHEGWGKRHPSKSHGLKMRWDLVPNRSVVNVMRQPMRMIPSRYSQPLPKPKRPNSMKTSKTRLGIYVSLFSTTRTHFGITEMSYETGMHIWIRQGCGRWERVNPT